MFTQQPDSRKRQGRAKSARDFMGQRVDKKDPQRTHTNMRVDLTAGYGPSRRVL